MTKVKKGFTLAEILITLAIIGVVAAMTIPTLISKINTIVTENQVKVFNAKLIKGLNLTKTTGDLNNTYSSTYDFLVNGLGKNLKMTKVCDKNHIRDCIPYDKIKYEKSDGSEDSVNVKNLNPSKMQLDIDFKDIAAFVLSDGTPAIVSYNLKCIDDPDKADTTINACLAGIYDLNGTRNPNKFGTKIEDEKTVFIGDIRNFNGARVGNATCLSIKGQKICIKKGATDPYSVWQNYFDTIPKTPSNWIDYWAIANKYCEANGGHLPSETELTTIAKLLYDDTYGTTYKIKRNEVMTALGFSINGSMMIWTDKEATNKDYAYGDIFMNGGYLKNLYEDRLDSGYRAVCLGE